MTPEQAKADLRDCEQQYKYCVNRMFKAHLGGVMTKPEFGVGDLVDCTITGTNLIAACVDHRTYMVNQLCVKVTGDRDLVQVSGWVYFFDGFPHGVEERYLRPHNPPSNTEDTAYTTFKSTLDFTRIKEGEIA